MVSIEQFMGPIMRELCLLTGMGAASRNNMKYVLTNKGRWSEKGQVCALIIGLPLLVSELDSRIGFQLLFSE